ncbi:MAG: DUF89 domain-containing protein [Desulfovibrio sp.]
MKTELDCLPCFFRQALTGARTASPNDAGVHERVLLELAGLLPCFDLNQPPPALAGKLYELLRRVTGVDDCFAEEKRRANARVLELLPELGQRVRASSDPLATALEISIIGNYIDAGVEQRFDWEHELEQVDGTLDPAGLETFRRRLVPGVRVLIVGDNAGEIGLDKLLVGELLALGAGVAYAVRDRPVLNDATLADAREVGLDRLCEVISSGADTPGAVLPRCTPGFRERLRNADLVLAKGQGNYEALTDSGLDVYFAFKVKCPVVAQRTCLPEMSSVFLRES